MPPKRQQFSNDDRKTICQIQKDNPGWTQTQITDEAAKKLSLPDLKRTSVTGILKESDKWLSLSDAGGSKRQRTVKWDKLEAVLLELVQI